MKTKKSIIELSIPDVCENCVHRNYCLAPTAFGCACFEPACDAE